MRRLLALIIAALVVGLTPARAQDVTVMSFNVRLPVATDGANAWPQRRGLAIRAVRAAAPDVIGTQELFPEQAAYLTAQLPHYAWFGRGRRGGGEGDEHVGILYRKDRVRLVRSGDFWLSDTPEVPGSITWGNVNPRMVTWAEFETRSKRRFYLFNTHFPYREEDEAARRKSALLLKARIAAIAGTAPAAITGDFNITPDGEVHRLLTDGFADAWDVATRRSGPADTFHGFTGTPDRRIDWLLVRGFTVGSVRTVTDHDGALYPSDHFPVVAKLRLR